MKQALYKQIKQDIIAKIKERVYEVNTKIPTEFELTDIYNTSRQTANKALSELSLEGYITRSPRSGSFVRRKEDKSSSILHLRSIADEVRERGNKYSNELVFLGEEVADQELANILEVIKDQKLFVSKIIHKENDVPIRFDLRFIKPSLIPRYLQQDFSKMTPTSYLQGVCPAFKVDNSIEAKMPNCEIQKYLDIKKDEPCLLISRTVKTKKEVATFSKIYYPSSRYKLHSSF